MHGPGVDEPILWDEGQAMDCSATRFLHTNHQGSVIAVADCNGNRTAINSYDPFGIPSGLANGSPPNSGRFGYTGQIWIAEVGMYYYKARFYSPTIGRFLQTDPIGYEDGLNWYAYVGGDPVNSTDPSGLITAGSCAGDENGNVSSSCSGQNVISAADAFRAGQEANAAKPSSSSSPLGKAVAAVSKVAREVDDTIDAALDIASDALDAVTLSASEIGEAILKPDIPSEAYETYNQYKEQNFQFRSGQSYGVHRYSNRGGELPSGGQYRAMFVRQFDFSRVFGPKPSERLIVDVKSGAAYYTPDHYKTFRKLGK